VKIQCDLCKEIVVADFAVVGDGSIEIVCPSCRGRYAAPATRARRVTGEQIQRPDGRPRRASLPPPQPGLPDMTCPKCGEVQPPAMACRTCGLQASRMADYAAAEQASVPEAVAAAWEDARVRWSDPDAHERFVQSLAAAECYPWGARRYREILRERPGDTVAAEQIARLARMAEATLLAGAVSRQAPSLSPYRGISIVVFALILAIAAGLVYTLFLKRADTGEGRRTPAVPAPQNPKI
jgi:hypothetical protein